MLTQQMLLAYGAAVVTPPSIEYIATTMDAVDRTTYTFAGASIGAADATRRVFAICYWAQASSLTLSSATIAGGAATIHLQATGSPSPFPGQAIISALVPTGTTATIAFTLSGGAISGQVAVFRALNEANTSPHDTMSDTTLSANTLSGTIDIPSGGWLLSGAYHTRSGGPGVIGWTGNTVAFEQQAENSSFRISAALDNGMTVEAGRTVSSNSPTGTTTAASLVSVSWS
jgi:hypothetical protein